MLVEAAPAKVNLALHVVGRRPDRYHLLESLVVFADVADEHLRKADAGIAALPRELRAVFAPRAVLGQQLRRLSPDAPFVRMEDVADWRKIAALGWWKLRNA